MRPRRIGFWYRLAVSVVKPLLLLFTKRDWRGIEHLRAAEGTGVIVAVNHLSYVDPFIVTHFLYDNGLLPRFLAKSELFRVRFVGRLLRGAQQIPVHRGSADASLALRDAVAALRRGECLLIYPEGTATRDPHLWPMRAKTGVARLALLSGAPVIPVAQWGAQQILPYPTKKPHLLPQTRVQLLAGPAVDLSPWRGRELTADVLREATEAVMTRIAGQLEQLRGESWPGETFEPATSGVVSVVTEFDRSRRSA